MFQWLCYFKGVEFSCPYMINFCSLDGLYPSMLEGLCRNCLDASKAYTLFGF